MARRRVSQTEPAETNSEPQTETQTEPAETNEQKFHRILAKQREDSAKKGNPAFLTHEQRQKQTEKFTDMIATHYKKEVPKEVTHAEREANRLKITAMLDKQREDAEKAGKKKQEAK